MGETEFEEIVKGYLSLLLEKNLVDDDSFAVVFDSVYDGPPNHRPIEVVVVSNKLGPDLVGRQVALNEATWETNPRIQPFAVTASEWDNYVESPKLTRAKATGTIVKL